MMYTRSPAREDAAAIGPGSGGGGCVVMTTAGCEGHFDVFLLLVGISGLS